MKLRRTCPRAECREQPPHFKRHGFYRTRWNRGWVRRYRCLRCRLTFSTHTFKPTYRQKRPDINLRVYDLYVSTMTQRRLAKHLKVNRKTVVRKFLFLARHARFLHEEALKHSKAEYLQFDEMETFEQTRLKPLSIALAVNPETGHLVGANVASFACKGKSAAFARQKYGFRPDTRAEKRKELLVSLQSQSPTVITTDRHPGYPKLIKQIFPDACHKRFAPVKYKRNLFHKNRRRNKKDALFALNFVAAKIRHDLSRMLRRVWVTTKKPERLQAHLDLYTAFHNSYEVSF